MAARDYLKRIYGTSEETAPLPYGEKARKYSSFINSIYTKLNQNEWDKKKSAINSEKLNIPIFDFKVNYLKLNGALKK